MPRKKKNIGKPESDEAVNEQNGEEIVDEQASEVKPMPEDSKKNKETTDENAPAISAEAPATVDGGETPKETTGPVSSNDEDNDYTLSHAGEDDATEDEESNELQNGVQEAESMSQKSGNLFLRKLMDTNFIEYASYVIKERAIPDVDDGLKPVQRRILWSLFRLDDGKFHKVANVIGHTMQYHPHGDASIGDALVVLANKEYYIEKQGNFGNIFTGDAAAAPRYIESRLSPLARDTLFNKNITEFVDSYDGRNQEPVALPVKIPSLLMLGADGIAVGMATKIMPHNFKELIEAQIAILRKEPFEVFPDFTQGGIMDVSEYEEGNGKITIRAKIDIEGRKLIIRELPATTTTESLILSIEKAVARNKMKLAAINDYTTDSVEIEIVPMRGYDPQKALKALYAYTDCSVSISANLTVICDNQPCVMSVPDVLRRNTSKLVEYLRRELEIELAKLEDAFHDKTLAQIFIENRIYKRIEECKTYELVLEEVLKGLKKFRKMLKRDVSEEDVEKLLAIPIRRISLFDINKNRKDIDDILKQMEQIGKNLKRMTSFAIKYLNSIIEKYAVSSERKTEIESFDRIDKQAVALNNIRVSWDRKNCYVGTSVKSDDRVTCNEYDHLLCLERKGVYKVIMIPEKLFIGRLYYFAKYDKNQTYFIVYSEKKTGKYYTKQSKFDKFITDREYSLCPDGCKLEIITTRPNSIYEFQIDTRAKDKQKLLFNLSDAQERSAKARGQLISPKKVLNYKFIEILGDEEEDLEDGRAETPSVEKEPVLLEVPADELDAKKPAASADATDKQKEDTPKSDKSEDQAEKNARQNKKKDSTDPAKTNDDKGLDIPKKESTKEKPSKPESKPAPANEKESKKPTVDKPSTTKDDDDDDLGITQPEFGF